MLERRKVQRSNRDKLVSYSDRLVNEAKKLEQFSAEIRQRYKDEINGPSTGQAKSHP